jgi:hypothetical protein
MNRLISLLSPICLLACLVVPATQAQVETILYTFNLANGTAYPEGTPVLDKSGNLFGVTTQGGAYVLGAAYQLTPSNTGWIETTVYSFCPSRGPCPDGSAPLSLISDGENFYGTALGGNSGCGNNGCGVVFELTHSGSTWTESVLYTFSGGRDGAFPIGSLVFDKQGNLYGTTQWGGTGGCHIGIVPGCGTVFELTPVAGGGWTETVLHSFQGLDGDNPLAGLILDATGNLYGTTAGVSATDPGLVFRLAHTANGWKQNILYRFTGGVDGSNPEGSLIFDKSGNLFGTTQYGGTGNCTHFGYSGCGVVFQLSLVNGRIRQTVIHDFQGGSNDGAGPVAGLIFDKLGGMDGTTASGGNDGFSGCGTVFRITEGVSGKVQETLIHRFDPSTGDGCGPSAGFATDSAGNLYSTTYNGGPSNDGIVFEISR